MLHFYNKVSSLRETTDIPINNVKMNIKPCIKFWVLNRLISKETLKNSEELSIALYIAEYYAEMLSGQENYKSILDGKFGNFYEQGIRISNICDFDYAGIYFRRLTYEEKIGRHIPEDYQKVYELYRRIRDVFESADNIQEILCPDLVKIIITKDFYKRLGKSYDKNKKIRPEILFEGYRNGAEFEKNKESTGLSNEALDL